MGFCKGRQLTFFRRDWLHVASRLFAMSLVLFANVLSHYATVKIVLRNINAHIFSL